MNRNRVHCSKLASLLVFAMNVALRSKHQAPKREAFVCSDASLTRSGSRRSRELAPGWQIKGADIHFKDFFEGNNKETGNRLFFCTRVYVFGENILDLDILYIRIFSLDT